MTNYDYRVTPAPKRLKRIKGVSSTAELFSATLAEAINAAAREGWEYLRAESLPAAEPGRWFRRGGEVIETVLVFRRPRETLGPRLAAARPEETDAAEVGLPRFQPAEGPSPERSKPSPLRREPRFDESAEAATTTLRPGPRLGPADQL